MRAAYEAAIRNELPYFAPVTKFPGFARATAAAIGELRAAGIAAEKLEALEESGPDHAALLERFQEQMEEVSVADRTILFRSALEEVRAGADFARHPLLLMDVPIHSAIERSISRPVSVRRKRTAVHLSCRRPPHTRQSEERFPALRKTPQCPYPGFEPRAAGLLSLLGDNPTRRKA